MKWMYLFIVSAVMMGCQAHDGNSGDAENSTKDDQVDLTENADHETEPEKMVAEEEIESLVSFGDQISFLRTIIKSDLDTRKEQSNALQTHGYNSTEYKKLTSTVEELDQENITRIVGFVEKFGVPENQSVGRMQAEAMWLVMTHNSDIELYRRMFPALEEAWKKEYLEETSFASFLQDYHRLVNGDLLMMKNPYRTSDEIKALLKVMKGEIQQ